MSNHYNNGGRAGETEQMAQPQYLKVFIPRDYTDGTIVRFQRSFPQELEGRLEKQTFESTINRLNEIFEEAEKASCSAYCEGCFACVTAYLIYLCKETRYEKKLRKVSKFIAEQNERVFEPRGLKLTDPSSRGLRVLEISCFDRPPNA
ncbi:golgin subfamily A member 7 [Dendroctonus ponderosae]|uniref:Ras modification protein ERF4 n=1 Tax=Dendroctonus ponderosae TaxID=77166 RepID=J3JVD3_DENPD